MLRPCSLFGCGKAPQTKQNFPEKRKSGNFARCTPVRGSHKRTQIPNFQPHKDTIIADAAARMEPALAPPAQAVIDLSALRANPEGPAPAPAALEGVLASRASELTGRAQTSRNELFALFGVWVGFCDTGLSKAAAEAQDLLLREDARRLYLEQLAGSGARVEYRGHASRVSWRGFTAERQVGDGRSAARNAFVDILRKFLASSGVRQWPVPQRPALDPRLVEGIIAPAGDADPGPCVLAGDDLGFFETSSWPAPARPPGPTTIPDRPLAKPAKAAKAAKAAKPARAPAGDDLGFFETSSWPAPTPCSLLVGGYRKGQAFSSPFATRHVGKGEVGLVVEQVSGATCQAPFLRVDFGRRGVVDFNVLEAAAPLTADVGTDAPDFGADAPDFGADAPDIGAVLDIDAFKLYAEQVAKISIKRTALWRLYALFKLIHAPDAPVKSLARDGAAANNCVLGFRHLEVKQPEFYQRICELVDGSLWHALHPSVKPLKKPTWVVYELLRQIGVRPVKHTRGPPACDPGPKEFMYTEQWAFNRQTCAQNCHRLQVNGIARGRGIGRLDAPFACR